MEKELAYLGKAISNPERPFVAVLGGAKVSDKIEVVQNLMKLADAMLIGGAMAYTFLKSQGLPIGKSLVENDKLDLARSLLEEAQQPQFQAAAAGRPRARRIAGLDRNEDRPISPPRPTAGWASTSARKPSSFSAQEIAKARTIVWNGPLGMFEKPGVCAGHARHRESRRRRHQSGATSIIGGGDSVAAVEQSGCRRIRFRTSPPAAARRLNFSRAKSFPASKRSRTEPSALRDRRIAPPRHRRQLEDVQDAARKRARSSTPFCRWSQHRTHCDIVVAPPFTAIAAAVEAARGTAVAIAAQNLHWEREGAFTGEISRAHARGSRLQRRDHRPFRAPPIFRRDGRDRQSQDEGRAGGRAHADRLRRRDARRARGQSSPMPCCSANSRGGFAALTPAEFSRILIAYEPVWAIGTGRTATPEIAADAHRHIRELAAKLSSRREQASALRILYGGSVKPDNIKGLMAQDGYRWRAGGRSEPGPEVVCGNREFLERLA